MNRYLTCILGLCIIFFNNSCRKKDISDVNNQDNIFSDFSITYKEQNASTYVKAIFFHKSPRGYCIRLDDDSPVFYRNTRLTPATKKGVKYTSTVGGYDSGGFFSWTDLDGNTYENQATLPASISLNNVYTTFISTKLGHSIYWIGDPLEQGEKVVLTVKVQGDSSFTESFKQTFTGRNFVHIPANKMKKIYGHEAKLKISRVRYSKLTESTTVGGRITAKYESEGSWLYSF